MTRKRYYKGGLVDLTRAEESARDADESAWQAGQAERDAAQAKEDALEQRARLQPDHREILESLCDALAALADSQPIPAAARAVIDAVNGTKPGR